MMDLVPVDLIPLILVLGIPYLKVVPTTDLNLTVLAWSVFCLYLFFSIREKGFIGFIKSITLHPFGPWMLPANLFVEVIDMLAKPLSLALRLYGNLYAGEMIFLLIAGMVAWQRMVTGIVFGVFGTMLSLIWAAISYFNCCSASIYIYDAYSGLYEYGMKSLNNIKEVVWWK